MMKNQKKLMIVVTLLLVTLFFSGFSYESDVYAEENDVGIPVIKVKLINSKTGVKITINKTKGAKAYRVYLTGVGNEYAEYLNDPDYGMSGYYGWKAEIGYDGSKKRTYTIQGLPQGQYKIRVATLDKLKGNAITYSEIKNISIKKAKVHDTKEKKYDFSKVKVGDTITFGSYEQDDVMTNGKEEIEWIVLSKDKKKILLLSKYGLDSLPYNYKQEEITWEDCSLRNWLNVEFYKKAFTKNEQALILPVNLKNPNVTGTFLEEKKELKGGNDTKDKIFLLSLDDMVKYGFDNDLKNQDISRRVTATKYTIAKDEIEIINGKADFYYENSEGKQAYSWWLRSPALNIISKESSYFSKYAARVNLDGSIRLSDGAVCSSTGLVVRPALYISLL